MQEPIYGWQRLLKPAKPRCFYFARRWSNLREARGSTARLVNPVNWIFVARMVFVLQCDRSRVRRVCRKNRCSIRCLVFWFVSRLLDGSCKIDYWKNCAWWKNQWTYFPFHVCGNIVLVTVHCPRGHQLECNQLGRAHRRLGNFLTLNQNGPGLGACRWFRSSCDVCGNWWIWLGRHCCLMCLVGLDAVIHSIG